MKRGHGKDKVFQGAGVSKQQPRAPNPAATCLIGTQPYSFVHVLFLAAFVPQRNYCSEELGQRPCGLQSRK